MRAPATAGLAIVLTALLVLCAVQARSQAPPIKPEDKRSGTTFLSPDLKAQQEDEGANPGMLWVAEGEKLWRTPAGSEGKSCATCHGDAEASMKGVATHYPRVDPLTGKLQNLELKINQCRTERQGAPAMPWESQDLLGATAYVAYQSRGLPIKVTIDGPARPYFEKGRELFNTRQGQLNLSCSQCHDQSWGHRLRGDTISQGQPTGFPIYRLEWQSAGSLDRRLRACNFGVRAELREHGAPEYLALELYLAWRAEGLPIETPAIRR